MTDVTLPIRRFLVWLIGRRLVRISWAHEKYGLLPKPNRVREWNFYMRLLRWLCDD